MGLSVFEDKAKPPQENDLSEALGESKELWDQIKNHVKEIIPDIIEDWKHYGKSSGWTMKLLKKKRNLFFSYPGQGEFTVVFIFGDKAVQAVEAGSFPKDLVDTLLATKKFAEGRGLSVTVKSHDDVELVKRLITVKLEH